MTDAKPNAIEMLKLPQDAFMVEVSRAVSPKPWKHNLIVCFGKYECARCNEIWASHEEWLTCGKEEECLPPRLTEPPEWWARELRDRLQYQDRFPMLDAAKAISKESDTLGSMEWLYFATAQEQIAVCLVAMGHWRIEK